MALTLNQVISRLNEFADNHQQINHFFYGELYDFATSGTTNYPAMVVVSEPNILEGSTIIRSFNIYMMDLVHKDISDRREVLSDMEQVAVDLIFYCTNPTLEWVVLNQSVTLNDFVDKFDDEVSGYWFNLKLRESNPFDRCAIPIVGAPSDSSACSPVTIYNSDGSVNTTVPSGGSYTLPSTGGSGGSYEIYVNGVLNQSGTSTDFTTETFNINP